MSSARAVDDSMFRRRDILFTPWIPLHVTEPGPLSEPDRPLTLERIHDYVWTRYVRYETPGIAVDEDDALRLLDAHYRAHVLSRDAECFYYGILLYERSFARPADRRHLLLRAFQAFEAWRGQVSVGFAWPCVDDRMADVMATLRREGVALTSVAPR